MRLSIYPPRLKGMRKILQKRIKLLLSNERLKKAIFITITIINIIIVIIIIVIIIIVIIVMVVIIVNIKKLQPIPQPWRC